MLGAGGRGRWGEPGLSPWAQGQGGAPHIPRWGLAGAAQLGRGPSHVGPHLGTRDLELCPAGVVVTWLGLVWRSIV